MVEAVAVALVNVVAVGVGSGSGCACGSASGFRVVILGALHVLALSSGATSSRTERTLATTKRWLHCST